MKLNQVIALVSGKKTRIQKEVTDLHKSVQKPELTSGISRVYRPLDEINGEQLPPEKKLPQMRVKDTLSNIRKEFADLFDVIATQDWGNTVAKADIKVDGKTIIKDAPVTYMLFLEKQLEDLHTFVEKLPTLDPAEQWNYNPDVDNYTSQPSETLKTKKVMKSHVKYEATKEHPAQVETYTEDVTVGRWTTTKFSGAIPAKERNEMLARVRQLQEAVKLAREEGNNTEVSFQKVGDSVFDFVLGSK